MKSILSSIVLSFFTILSFGKSNPFGTKMTLTKLNGKSIKTDNVYLTIDEKLNKIYGKSACNNFNISFTKAGKKIKTGEGLGTMMACDEETMNLESEFLAAIQNKKFKVKTIGNTVILTDKKANTILEFEKQTQENVWNFIGKNHWKLISLNNVGMDYGKAAIHFNIKENKVNGNTGCNSFFGSYTVNGDAITFSQMGSTKMACLDGDKMKIEDEILKILSSKNLRYDVAEQTLNFYDGDKLVMIFGTVTE